MSTSPNKIGGWIPDIHGRGVKGDILKTVSERRLSKTSTKNRAGVAEPIIIISTNDI
jgi:hypothetical protein